MRLGIFHIRILKGERTADFERRVHLCISIHVGISACSRPACCIHVSIDGCTHARRLLRSAQLCLCIRLPKQCTEAEPFDRINTAAAQSQNQHRRKGQRQPLRPHALSNSRTLSASHIFSQFFSTHGFHYPFQSILRSFQVLKGLLHFFLITHTDTSSSKYFLSSFLARASRVPTVPGGIFKIPAISCI